MAAKKKINSKVSEIHTVSVCLQNVIIITYTLVGVHVKYIVVHPLT